jgi:hypothetical protein
MNEIIYKLPKEVELSQHIKKKALGYLNIQCYGLHYYVPITKEIKKQFSLIERKGKLIPQNYKAFNRLIDIMRLTIDSIYLQVRDVVSAGIEEKLDGELKQGFSNLFEKYLHNRVQTEITKRIPYKAK